VNLSKVQLQMLEWVDSPLWMSSGGLGPCPWINWNTIIERIYSVPLNLLIFLASW
jgi:hypothetical protein